MINESIVFDPVMKRAGNMMKGFRFQVETEDGGLTVECRKMEQGISVREKYYAYSHPCPAFSRLFIFRSGGAKIHTENGMLNMREGNIYLLPSKMPFRIRYSPGILIFFHLHICDRAGNSIFSGKESVLHILETGLFERFLHASDTGNKIGELAGIFSVLAEILPEKLPELKERAKQMQEFALMFEYLEKHPPASVGIAELADLYGIESSALSKRFQRKMGYSLKHHLTERQLILARELLLYGTGEISEVAKMLGHRDISYFYRFFKKHTGTTPLEFRNGKDSGS